jgi:hypothetical protein
MLRDRILERHHLLPSGEAVAVVARDLGDFQLLARLDELLPDPPRCLLLAKNEQLKALIQRMNHIQFCSDANAM